ncbi:MAG TPA: SulP family inorganic anion transporter [Candidatus Paceibacterota bacterium]
MEIADNWKSGLSVALVNIPLSLSLAIASGASPTAGIITAIWAGLIAAIFGGSHFNIIGPAGALSGILAGYALVFGPAVLPIVALISGIVTLAVWALKWDKYIVFIPSSVVHGFTLSVAFVIGLGQLNFALGLSNLPKHEHLVQNVHETFSNIGLISWPTFTLFAVGLAMMFAILKFKPRWPNSVIVAVFGIAVSLLSSAGYLPFAFETLQTRFGNLSLSLFDMSHLTWSAFNMATFKAVPLVAVIVILETLLSAKIADGMTKTRFNQGKEVFGVGLANIASGLFGGLPATGVFARTALNVKSGAKSRYSAIINVFAVVIISVALLRWFSYLPLAIVASILIYLSLRMVAKEHFVNLYRFDKTAFWISLAVAFLSIVYDPLIGILAGSAVALLVFVKYLSKAQCELVVGKFADTDFVKSSEGGSTISPRQEIPGAHMKRVTAEELELEEVSADVLVYRFVGELNYMNAERYKELTHKIAHAKHVIFNFKNLFYVDVDGLDALDEIIEELEGKGKHVYVSGISKFIQPMFLKKDWYNEKAASKSVFETTKEAAVVAQQRSKGSR